jgi:hypothetical protein
MTPFTPFNEPFNDLESNSGHIQHRIRIRIPKDYQQDPIISDLITKHQLTINIEGALLGTGVREDGWFDLLLQGSAREINAALVYLNDLDIEIWKDSAHNNW